MHTEHLQNVHTARVLAGWLVAIAVTSLIILALIGLGLLEGVANAGTFWSLIAVLAGFFAGGFFAGFRAIEAPILHGAAIGLTSLVVWVAVNLITSVTLPDFGWQRLTPSLAVALLLVQLAAAVVGALIGYSVALRGRPGLSEHEPLPD
ncbi:MAG: hypothetical protein ACREM1_24980 [Longimicrobiales bacterium]